MTCLLRLGYGRDPPQIHRSSLQIVRHTARRISLSYIPDFPHFGIQSSSSDAISVKIFSCQNLLFTTLSPPPYPRSGSPIPTPPWPWRGMLSAYLCTGNGDRLIMNTSAWASIIRYHHAVIQFHLYTIDLWTVTMKSKRLSINLGSQNSSRCEN